MAAYKAIPAAFAKMHPKNLTPTVSTIVMGAISIVLYIPFNYLAGGNLIYDAVTAIGLYIAFYYGLTAFECVWYYRKTLTKNSRDLWMQGILPFLGGLIMYVAGGFSLWQDYDVNTGNSYTMFTVPGLHWEIGGAFMVALGAAVVGFIGYAYMRITAPAFFRKETLTRGTPTLVPDPDQ
jgi:amino acid transporter